jgi:hypothetical protein
MNTSKSRAWLTLALLSVSCAVGEAQTTNTPGPGFQRLGRIKARDAKDIASSSWSVGGETLDRDFGDYHGFFLPQRRQGDARMGMIRSADIHGVDLVRFGFQHFPEIPVPAGLRPHLRPRENDGG